MFWGLLRKKSLEEILFKMLPTARNQSSELRWIFLVAYGKKSLEEIFNKNMAYGQKYIIGI